MMAEVHFYATNAGNSPVERYLESLPARERASLLDVFEEIRHEGLAGAGVAARQIDRKLWELKVSRHRVFYVMLSGPRLVLLHAYKKQSQKAPPAEIDLARSRMKEVLGG